MDNRLTVLIPCYNEEVTIEKKVKDLFRPTNNIHEVVIIDDHSLDQTAKIIGKLKKKYKKLTYLSNLSKKGKASAVRLGIQYAKTDLVAITDADVLIEKSTLENIVKKFERPDVGMVGADLKPIAVNPITGKIKDVITLSDKFIHGIRLLLSRIDSLPLLHCQLVVIRKSIGIQPKVGIRADDVDMAIRMRLRGYKTILAPDAWFLQTVSDKDDFTKRLRRDEGTIATLWQYRKLFLNYHYGKYGLICFPFCFSLYFILPFFLIMVLFLPFWYLPTTLQVIYILLIFCISQIRKLMFYDTTLLIALVKIIFLKRTVFDSWSTLRRI
jgi:cellulose synthase/poly-beta-1,6-N-acetylglucosamine synthase-like glycosyltransferase